jgi:hypothetical protein
LQGGQIAIFDMIFKTRINESKNINRGLRKVKPQSESTQRFNFAN